MRTFINKIFGMIGYVPAGTITVKTNAIETKPNFELIVSSCNRTQLNALVYKAIEVASKDPGKKDLLKRWSNKTASYLEKPEKWGGNIKKWTKK